MDKDEFPVPLRLIHIGFQVNGIEFPEPQLFFTFPEKGFRNAFPVGYMAAHGGVPIAGKKVFGEGTFLQVQLSVPVQDVQMDHRMEYA